MIDFEEDIEETQGSEQIGNVTRNSMSWVQKYRPKTLEHFCLEPKLMKIFKEQIENDNIQSCTLVGSPGIGKTTLALILANSSPNSNILFVSCASGEGKIDSIQSKIVPFCQCASRGKKFVILDELDSASSTQANSFQKALRNVIEAHTDVVFIATANYGQNILNPLYSRMPEIDLNFTVTDMINNLLYIMGEEKIQIVSNPSDVKKFLGKLIKSYFPDMRMVIGYLQQACSGRKLDVDAIVMDHKELIHTTIGNFIDLILSSPTPLDMRKNYNNQVLSFGNNGGLSDLMTPYGLAKNVFDYIVDNFNTSNQDLIDLVEYLYKIDKCVDKETMLFGFLLKVKSMGLKQ